MLFRSAEALKADGKDTEAEVVEQIRWQGIVVDVLDESNDIVGVDDEVTSEKNFFENIDTYLPKKLKARLIGTSTKDAAKIELKTILEKAGIFDASAIKAFIEKQ